MRDRCWSTGLVLAPMTSDSTASPRPKRSTAAGPVRHTKEDALTDLQFERLYTASYELDRWTDVEARLVLMLAGRLGLRRGEISHMSADWVDFRKRRVNIPRYVDCQKGRDQRACAACRQHAQQRADHNEDVTFEEALANRWQPKTENAVRSVPFGHSPRTELVLYEYFGEFDQWMYSNQAINRRVNEMAEHADLDANVYPHALRATAATRLAGQGMSMVSIQAMLGWAQVDTAMDYIAQSTENTERELHVLGR